MTTLNRWLSITNELQRKEEALLELERLLRYAWVKKLPIENGKIKFVVTKKNFQEQESKLGELRRNMSSLSNQSLSSVAFADLGEWDNSDNEVNDSEEFWDVQANSIKLLLGEFMGIVQNYSSTKGTKREFDLKIDSDTSSILNLEGYNFFISKILFEFDDKWNKSFQEEKQRRKSKPDEELQIEENSKKLDRFLLGLNYISQENDITTAVNQRVNPNVILLEINDCRMQRWMINRLLRKNQILSSSRAKHRIYSGGKGSFVETFQENPSSLQLFLDRQYEEAREFQSILFTVHGMETMREGQWNSYLGNFLQNTRIILEEDSSKADNAFIILLAGDIGWISKHESYFSDNSILRIDNSSWGQLHDQSIDSWRSYQPNSEPESTEYFLNRLSGNIFEIWKLWIGLSSPCNAVETICREFIGADAMECLDRIWKNNLKMQAKGA